MSNLFCYHIAPAGTCKGISKADEFQFNSEFSYIALIQQAAESINMASGAQGVGDGEVSRKVLIVDLSNFEERKHEIAK